MNSTDELDEQILTLTELGLRATQAKVYLALVKSNNVTAQAIASLSSVSRPDVYRILSQLQASGYVEKILGKPEAFRAIPVEDCISMLLEKRTKKTGELQAKSIDLIERLKNVEAAQTPRSPESEFVFMPAKQTAYVRSEKMLKSLKKSIYFLGLPKRMNAWLAHYAINVEEVLSRGVDCRVILPAQEALFKGPFSNFKKYQNFKVKTIEGPPKASFSIWDNRQILLTSETVDIPFPKGTLWSSNQSLIALCVDYFECLWEKAKYAKPEEEK